MRTGHVEIEQHQIAIAIGLERCCKAGQIARLLDGGVSDGQMNKAHNYTESYVDGFNGLGLKTLNYQLIYFDAPYDLATLFTANGAGRGAFLICAAVADECTPDAPILSGSFSPENVSVTAIVGGGGAPEPATWALMIAGFGVTGLALRLRSARDRFAFG